MLHEISFILVIFCVLYSGLDVPNVGAVVNLNVPADPNDYVHRVGRTSRKGMSYS